MKADSFRIESIVKKLDFNKMEGLIPAITQEKKTKDILMLAYMNKEAFKKTLETGLMHYWSRSRNKLWKKGEESGNIQHVKEGFIDCDGDALLFRVEQTGSCCHTGEHTCFYEKIGLEEKPTLTTNSSILEEVFNVILDRQKHPKKNSYVASLLEKGEDQILRKVTEETTELVLATKEGIKEEIIHESADILFHMLVLLAHKGVDVSEVFKELRKRRK